MEYLLLPNLSSQMLKKLLLTAVGILLLIYLVPSTSLPWSLIDDGQRIQINQGMEQSLSEHNLLDFIHIPIDKNDSRFRPTYWVYHYLNYSIFGLSVVGHHLVKNILLVLFIVCLYSLVKKISNSFTAILTVFLVLLFPTNLENWWRLGPQEPLLVSFATFSLWFLIVRQKLLPALLFSVLFFFTKESSIFVIPALILGYLLVDKGKTGKLYKKYLNFNLGLGLVATLIMFLIKQGSGYSSYFETSLGSIIITFTNSTLLLKSYGFRYIIILVSIYLAYQALVKKKLSKPVLLALLLTASALLIQLPWPVPLGRYLLPFSVSLSFIVAYAIDQLLRQKLSFVLALSSRIFLLLSVSSLMFYSSLVMISFASDYYVREVNNQQLISQLATDLKPDSRLFINLTDELNAWEWYDEVQVNLDLHCQKTPQTFYARLLREGGYQLEENDILISWNQFQDLTDAELDSLVAGMASQNITGYYHRPSGGVKTLIADLLKHPKEFLSFKSEYWATKYYRWTIYSPKTFTSLQK